MTVTWTRYTMHDNIIYGPVLVFVAPLRYGMFDVACYDVHPSVSHSVHPSIRPSVGQSGGRSVPCRLINKSYIWIQIAALAAEAQKLQQKCQIWHEIIYANNNTWTSPGYAGKLSFPRVSQITVKRVYFDFHTCYISLPYLTIFNYLFS